MKELNYRNILPDIGTIAVMGETVEDPLIRAMAYEIAEGKNLKLIPTNPQQISLAEKLDIPIVRGFPDYFFFEADREPKEGYFTIGKCDSPMLLRLYEMGADKTIVFLRNKYHTISVEYTTYMSDIIEPVIALYGEIVARRETPYGNNVVDIVPTEEDVEELRKLLKEIPGVAEVGIIPTIPYRKIFWKV